MHYLVNAGVIPPDTWVHDRAVNGGRIVGEACHFIDLLAFLAGASVVSVAAAQMGGAAAVREDKMAMVQSFADGSVGTVSYFANGSRAYPKETVEVFSEGRVARLDNFRRTTGYGFRGLRSFGTRRQDKGHNAEMAAFVERVAQGGPPLMPAGEWANVTLASFAAVTSAEQGRTIRLDEEYGLP
ncbi:MAG: Gfo/Idh/MocA family oxidoreductase [Candidatus Latescibacterota bacterium]